MNKAGMILAGAYLILSAYLLATQGLFGESFIALILGMPWSLVFSFIEFGQANGALLIGMLLLPIIFNAYILYWIGNKINRA